MSILARVWWPALRDVTEQQARSTVTSLAWRRRTRSVVGSGLPWLLMVCLVPVLGCQDLGLTGLSLDQLTFETKTKDKSKERFDEGFDLDDQKEVQPPFIGDYVTVSGLNLVTLEGVGLVTGLDGTGGDPPPSQFRTQLLDDMRRRDIPDPNRIISSPSTALVIVRAYLPPLVQPGDRFDVEIRVPDGSTVTSLNGGWLLECRLTERAIVPGKGILEGRSEPGPKGRFWFRPGKDPRIACCGVDASWVGAWVWNPAICSCS